MIVRKVLVPVDGSASDRAALQTGFAVAAAFGAHIAGLHVRVEPIEAVPFVGEGMSGALVQELIELSERESSARAAAAREVFDSVQRAAGFPTVHTPQATGPSAEWVERAGGAHQDAIVRAGRLADLVVVGRPVPGGDTWADTMFSLALFETGRPVLVAAAETARQPPGMPGRHIVVAWNGSSEAARAIAAALPFLARAERVTVIAAGADDVEERSLEGVAEYLAWHGISAERRLLPVRDSVGEVLTAASADADLLVMGGYSHSRLRELILGGVTRHMLEKATLPLLVAH